MRKIISLEDKEKSEAKKRRIIVVIVSAILLFSVLGYSFRGTNEENTEKRTYGGLEFQLTERGWGFNVQGMQFFMQYLPEETINISANITLNAQDYANQPVYFSTESSREGIVEIQDNLYNIAFRMQYACLSENCTEYAVKNCTEDFIILIKEANETFISQDDKCINIEAKPGETIRASDRFLYKIFGFD